MHIALSPRLQMSAAGDIRFNMFLKRRCAKVARSIQKILLTSMNFQLVPMWQQSPNIGPAISSVLTLRVCKWHLLHECRPLPYANAHQEDECKNLRDLTSMCYAFGSPKLANLSKPTLMIAVVDLFDLIGRSPLGRAGI